MIHKRWSGRTIWDTRIQGIAGILSASGDYGVEIYFSATFAQVCLKPPQIIVNPNRSYAIEEAINKGGTFAINVLAHSQRNIAIQLMRMRRRQPCKAEMLGLEIERDEHDIPYLKETAYAIFCKVSREIPSGDRRLYVATVLGLRTNASLFRERPLLFSEVTTPSSKLPRIRKLVRTTAVVTGILDVLKTGVMRIRPAVVADIAAATYEEGGATEAELETIQSYGLLDRNRLLLPGTAPAVIKKQIGVCVVGTGWGSFHCRLVRQASPSARLFVCGQNAQRTAKLAKVVGADDFFIDINAASQDPRIQAFTLAIPHDLHRPIVEVVIGAGKSALVEKPIATTLQDADAMIGASKKSGALLIVAEDLHFRPAIREATRRIALGDVGEPLYLLVHGGGIRRPRGWAAIRERMGGGVLLDIGVHYVRALRLLMGEPHKVFAWRAMQIDTKIEGEDSVQLMFSSDVGWGAHMLLSWSSQRGNLPDMVLAGETGTFHFWPGASYYDYYPVTPRGLTRGFSYLRPHWLRDKLMTPRLQRIRLAVPDNDPTGYVNEFKEFLSAVAEDRKSITPPEDARRDLEIVLSAYDALGSGQSTSIKSPC